MHDMEYVEFINAQQAKSTYKYKNTKEKSLKMKAAMWFNKMCRENHFK